MSIIIEPLSHTTHNDALERRCVVIKDGDTSPVRAVPGEARSTFKDPAQGLHILGFVPLQAPRHWGGT